MSERTKRYLIGGGSIATFLIVWEVVSALGIVNPLFISSPSSVVTEGISLLREDRFWGDVRISATAFGWGFGVAALAGVPLGIALGRFRRFRLLAQPTMMAAYVTPRLALLPVLIIWLGVGVSSAAAVVFLGAVFPIVIQAMAGITTLDASWLRASKSFGASERQMFFAVMLPGALPYVVSGMRLGFGRGLLGVIVAEMYVSTGGLGNLIIRSGQSFQTGQLMFLVIMIAFFGAFFTLLLRFLESWWIVWAPSGGAQGGSKA